MFHEDTDEGTKLSICACKRLVDKWYSCWRIMASDNTSAGSKHLTIDSTQLQILTAITKGYTFWYPILIYCLGSLFNASFSNL